MTNDEDKPAEYYQAKAHAGRDPYSASPEQFHTGLIRDREKAEKEADAYLERAIAAEARADKADAHVVDLEARLSGHGRYLADGGYGRRVFKTLAEAREWANVQIEAHRANAHRTGKWPGQVEDVAVWVVIEQARAVPDDDGHDFELTPLPDQNGEVE